MYVVYHTSPNGMLFNLTILYNAGSPWAHGTYKVYLGTLPMYQGYVPYIPHRNVV